MPFIDGLILGVCLTLLFGALAWIFQSKPARLETRTVKRPATKSFKTKAASAVEVRKLIQYFPTVKVLSVCDGDTVSVERGETRVKVRLDSIDCPEDGQRWGDIATYGLIKMIGGARTVRIEEHGIDDFGRTLATLYVLHEDGHEWQNVNERMVTLGHAWVMRKYYDHLPPDRQDKLNKLEIWAKSKNVGLWSTPDPMPPWQWRKEVWRPPAH